jgi:hypothetical protein
VYVYREVQCLIDMAVITKVGDGSNSLFWKDWWLNGIGIKDVAPAIFKMGPQKNQEQEKS